MIKLADENACTGCSACKAVCPQNAISMVADAEGFLRPSIDDAKCVKCHLCERTCPVFNSGKPDNEPKCFAAKTKDENVRTASSSGGVFTELARYILSKGGLVFGCVFEKGTLVPIHTKAETESDLAQMRGSKYVQSDLRNTFKEVRDCLLKGRQVLFVGTPCQIAGLSRYISRADENLILVELICYGVPSPLVFEKHKKELEKKINRNLQGVNFRKKGSWHKSFISYTFDDGSEVKNLHKDDFYMKSFFANLSLRPSCFQCVAREGRSGADITIGDFWGIEQIAADFDDDKGVSAVLVHSSKGLDIWKRIESQLETISVDSDLLLKGNPFYSKPAIYSKKRNCFIESLKKSSLKKSFVYSVMGPFYIRILRKLFRVAIYPLRKAKRLLVYVKER